MLIPVFAAGLRAQTEAKQTVTEFMGQRVMLFAPAVDEFGIPQAPARVCFEGGGRCFQFPRPDPPFPPVGFAPEMTPIQIGKAGPALFFAATSYAGGSGGTVYLTLLRSGTGNEVDHSLLPDGLTLSMQSEHAFWSDPVVSSAPVFVTADYVWGIGECHICDHRFTISTYVLRPPMPDFTDDYTYDLADQYLTVRKYHNRVLASEKPEILARLKRVKAEEERRKQAPH